jgi:hypothetical protein
MRLLGAATCGTCGEIVEWSVSFFRATNETLAHTRGKQKAEWLLSCRTILVTFCFSAILVGLLGGKWKLPQSDLAVEGWNEDLMFFVWASF